MKFLGINAGHDSSVCVVDENGKIEYAVGEERFNRIKVFQGWPSLALSTISPDSYIVAIVNQKKMWKNIQKRYLDLTFGELIPFFDNYNKRNFRMEIGSRKRVDAEPILRNKLLNLGIKPHSLSFYDHHFCHASSAYYSSGYKDALVITADGAGDGRSASAHSVINGEWTEISSTSLPNSPGHMYSWATRFLGFKINRHEGKLTGLAAYGDSDNLTSLKDKLLIYSKNVESFRNPYLKRNVKNNFSLRKLNSYIKGKPYFPSYESFRSTIIEESKGNYKDEDIAALAQEELEKSVTEWIEHLVEKTGLHDVALAGGIFANVKLNQRIENIKQIKNIWIFPDMGDGGLSAGAAYLAKKDDNKAGGALLKDVYLGPKIEDGEIEKAIKASGIRAKKSENITKETAEMMSNRKIVGWFQGRMEYGPRALGNRSIIIHPGDKEINKIVNSRLKRTEFMPFAPSVLSEYADELFVNRKKSHHASEFMTITYDVNKEWVDKISAVVHVDNTARPQVVTKESNALYWEVIDEFRKITGIPVIVNTSFNMHEEPIVCSPDDAIRSFTKGAVDVLVLGDYILKKEDI